MKQNNFESYSTIYQNYLHLLQKQHRLLRIYIFPKTESREYIKSYLYLDFLDKYYKSVYLE